MGVAVLGECNQLARTSADMVTRQFGEVSPLVIHGPTGVGKTHLLEAIWCQARKRHSRGRILFLSAEQFTTYFLEALKGSGLPSFRRKYRQADLLIIDDLGIRPLPPQTIQDLYDLMEERYNQKSTIFTSQLPLENWKEVITDEVAYDAIMDRLVHTAIKLELRGDSYRKSQGQARNK